MKTVGIIGGIGPESAAVDCSVGFQPAVPLASSTQQFTAALASSRQFRWLPAGSSSL